MEIWKPGENVCWQFVGRTRKLKAVRRKENRECV